MSKLERLIYSKKILNEYLLLQDYVNKEEFSIYHYEMKIYEMIEHVELYFNTVEKEDASIYKKNFFNLLDDIKNNKISLVQFYINLGNLLKNLYQQNRLTMGFINP